MENVRNYVGIASEKQTTRLNNKLSKLEAKEMQQVANEKTLAKHLSSTMQKETCLVYHNEETLKAEFVKHVNFCAKHRKSTLCGFDATAIKKAVTSEILFNFLDVDGLKKVQCVSFVIGLLDKQAKEMKKKQEKANK